MDFLTINGGPDVEVLNREPVTDTNVSCPVCGQQDWERVDVRADPQEDYYRMSYLVCRACGNPWGGHSPVGRRRPGRASRIGDGEIPVSTDLDNEESIVEQAHFTVYVLDPQIAEERTLRQSGWETATTDAGKNTKLADVTFAHRVRSGELTGPVTVRSSPFRDQDRDPAAAADQMLVKVLWDRAQTDLDWELSVEAVDLQRDQMLRDAEAIAANSTKSEIGIEVDGRDTWFVMARDGENAWSAAAVINAVLVLATSHDIGPERIRLQTLAARSSTRR